VKGGTTRTRLNHVTCHTSRVTLNGRLLAFALGARGDLVLAGLPFVVALADLLLDFFGYAVNRRVQIAFDVLREEVGAAHRQTDRTTELLSQDARVVVFKGDARVNGALIEVIKLLQPVQDVILNGFGQRYIVCRKNQLHGQKMQPAGNKIQRKCDGRAIPD